MRLWGKAALLGGIPLAGLAGIAAILDAQNEPAEARSTLAAAVIVGSVMAASVIYDIDSWSLKRQSVVHFVLMTLSVYPALCLSGWFPTSTAEDFVAIAAYFLVVGIAFWTIAYLVFGLAVPRLKNRSRGTPQ